MTTPIRHFRFAPAYRRTAAAALLLAMLAPAHAQQAKPGVCRFIKIADIPVQYTGPGLGITMEGSIDGTPARLLVDTGSSLTALTYTGTERRGLKLWGNGTFGRGIGGYTRIHGTRIKEFVAGPTRSVNASMQVIGAFGSPPDEDAILGAHFLLQTDFEIFLAQKRLSFFRPVECGDTSLAYWETATVAIPFEDSPSPSPNPRFTVLLNGTKMRAMIDSGASVTVVSLAAAKRTGLKLDAPGVERLGDVTGIGERRVARWGAVFDQLQIGEETITHAQVGVINTEETDVDVILGADFLRSHRVLFAMSQKKLYLSYVGGPPLGQRKGIEPWLAREAEQGNADAQMIIGTMYANGLGVSRDNALARSWLEKAAANGSPEANIAMGQDLVMKGRHGQAAAHLRRALDRRPGERYGALWLHAARLGSGEGALGRRELAQFFAHDDDQWPGPIARYYLGKIDRDKLLDEARDERESAPARTCLALLHIGAQLKAQGDDAGARTALEQRSTCLPRPVASTP